MRPPGLSRRAAFFINALIRHGSPGSETIMSGNRAGQRPPTKGAAGDGLSPAELIGLDYFAPPTALKPYITTLYSLHSDQAQVRDVMPAAVGYLLVFIEGDGRMHFPGERVDDSSPVSLLTPTTAAAITELDGPFRVVGAALSPLGWAAFTGLPADTHCDRLCDASEFLGPEIIALREELCASGADDAALTARVAEFIGANLKPVNSRHAKLIGEVAEWLSSELDPPLSALEKRAAYGGRQLQRLIERYFGVTPKQLVRKYRAIRVAALLQDPSTSDEQVAELLNLFYDQSHLIREVRHFLGRTPARLGDGANPLLEATSGLRNFREFTPSVARIPEN
jgi:AraC-like DNA-binding protein